MGQSKNNLGRGFISVGLLFTLILLFVTAVVIQIFEAIEADFYIHLFTVIHIFSGLVFTVFSIYHIIKNWKTLRGYIVLTKLNILYATIIMLLIILAGFLFVYYIMD